jgi:hypothetical protein
MSGDHSGTGNDHDRHRGSNSGGGMKRSQGQDGAGRVGGDALEESDEHQTEAGYGGRSRAGGRSEGDADGTSGGGSANDGSEGDGETSTNSNTRNKRNTSGGSARDTG